MKITITIDGITQTFTGEYEELHTKDWNEVMQSILDDVHEYETE